MSTIQERFNQIESHAFSSIKSVLDNEYLNNDIKFRLIAQICEDAKKVKVNKIENISDSLFTPFKAYEDLDFKTQKKEATTRQTLTSYFSNLPSWTTTKPDYIGELSKYIVAEGQQAFNEEFKKMLVRTVACAIGKIPFNKYCFVIRGYQNNGKTQLMRFLCPPVLRPYYKENLDVTSKDGQIALCENLFINFEGLDTLNKKEWDKLKSAFSVDKVLHRKLYSRNTEIFPRTASFLATTNTTNLPMIDTTNPKYLVFDIDSINHDNGGANGYNQNIDIDLVYSQAYALANDDTFDFESTHFNFS